MSGKACGEVDKLINVFRSSRLLCADVPSSFLLPLPLLLLDLPRGRRHWRRRTHPEGLLIFKILHRWQRILYPRTCLPFFVRASHFRGWGIVWALKVE